jgi:hypothetical protein
MLRKILGEIGAYERCPPGSLKATTRSGRFGCYPDIAITRWAPRTLLSDRLHSRGNRTVVAEHRSHRTIAPEGRADYSSAEVIESETALVILLTIEYGEPFGPDCFVTAVGQMRSVTVRLNSRSEHAC